MRPIIGSKPWTQRRLKSMIGNQFDGQPIFVVSNREPYTHNYDEDGNIEVTLGGGGLVAALNPIVQASGGMWIAHGSGSADRDVVDAEDKVDVTIGKSTYILKRLWLTPEQTKGHYDGFSNEGLWPLSHNTPVEPIFRASDWKIYKEVNQLFADALLEEFDERPPVVFIQDYHLMLVPEMIKKVRPDAQVAIFWHIPWADAERFQTCPYARMLVKGMLAADVVGLHTEEHQTNFLETAHELLEVDIDSTDAVVNYRGHNTQVKAFPISNGGAMKQSLSLRDRNKIRKLRRQYHLNNKLVAFGVDRLDYTKGILERLKAVERFLKDNPKQKGKFVFIQIGSPSRGHLESYHQLVEAIRESVALINKTYGTKRWQPIVYLEKNHTPEQVNLFYALADICIVSPLHDGMNLVAKEFIASRPDGKGVLLLSKFAGAAEELTQALLIDPYDTRDFAKAIKRAFKMPLRERASRLKAMREYLLEHNIYWWSGSILTNLANMRLYEEIIQPPKAVAGKTRR